MMAVFPTSNTVSESPRASETGIPGAVPAGSTRMPSWPDPRPSSSSAQIIPSLSTPRIFAFLSVAPFGSVRPAGAKHTTWPSATLGAPQTTRSGAAPP